MHAGDEKCIKHSIEKFGNEILFGRYMCECEDMNRTDLISIVYEMIEWVSNGSK